MTGKSWGKEFQDRLIYKHLQVSVSKANSNGKQKRQLKILPLSKAWASDWWFVQKWWTVSSAWLAGLCFNFKCLTTEPSCAPCNVKHSCNVEHNLHFKWCNAMPEMYLFWLNAQLQLAKTEEWKHLWKWQTVPIRLIPQIMYHLPIL